MGIRVGVLTPTAQTENERRETEMKLIEETTSFMRTLDENSSAAQWDEWSALSSTDMTYRELNKPPFYKTWDELRSSLKTWNCDEAIKRLKERGLIREGIVDLPESD